MFLTYDTFAYIMRFLVPKTSALFAEQLHVARDCQHDIDQWLQPLFYVIIFNESSARLRDHKMHLDKGYFTAQLQRMATFIQTSMQIIHDWSRARPVAQFSLSSKI